MLLRWLLEAWEKSGPTLSEVEMLGLPWQTVEAGIKRLREQGLRNGYPSKAGMPTR